jgi:hypothetical protein
MIMGSSDKTSSGHHAQDAVVANQPEKYRAAA